MKGVVSLGVAAIVGVVILTRLGGWESVGSVWTSLSPFARISALVRGVDASPRPASLAASGSDPSLLTAWIVNAARTTSVIYPSTQVDVQSVSPVRQGNNVYALVKSADIPSYSTVVTRPLLDTLRSRPRARTDFRNGGEPSIAIGETVHFGQDIGFRGRPCANTPATGYGYWPPGPECAVAQTTSVYFPLTPTPAASSSVMPVGGKVGLLVNGVSLFSWSDARSFNDQDVWHRTAADFEFYDVDIDSGHAARGEYHHHFYPSSLAAQLGDSETGHSPIYGFAFDGYPIHGPWTGAIVPAVSGWAKRDYDAVSSATGCGVAHARTCRLVDPRDVTMGTVPVSNPGPPTDATISTQVSNSIATVSGVFFEDYYFDRSCSSCLDEHNGHQHDAFGYHYHVTVTRAGDGTLTPSFPYTIGPTYYGELHANAALGSRPRPGSWIAGR